MAGIKALVGLAFAACIGLSLLALGCALPGVWWPLFVCVFYFLSPLPVTIASRMSDGSSDTSNPCREFALFATTGIVVSAFALPIVLAMAGIITAVSAALTCAASGVIFIAIGGWFTMHADDGWGQASNIF